MPQRSALRTTACVLTAAAVAARLAKAYRQRRRRRHQRAREAEYRVGPAWRRLRVAPSTIEGAGEGLFATERIAADETIGFYRGEVLTLREALQLKDRDYLMGGFGPNAHVDASKAFAMPGRYVNDAFDASRLNARFDKSKATRSARVVALRDIEEGEEIFASYGRSYWTARGVDVNGRSLLPFKERWRATLLWLLWG
jgi:SET domain-containing protein